MSQTKDSLRGQQEPSGFPSGPDFVFNFGLALLWFGLLAGSIAFWSTSNTPLLKGTAEACTPGLILTLIAFIWLRLQNRKPCVSPEGFTAALFVLFLSDWLTRGYNLFQGPLIRGEIIVSALVSLWLIKTPGKRFFHYIAAGTILLLGGSFFAESGGRLLFSDDHATFLYRLISLKENFPAIPFYNPLWNGGIDARDFFATGALNIFLLTSPLLYLFNPVSLYNLIVAAVLFLILPSSIWYACRLLGSDKHTASIASVLSLSSSLLWYRWALKYGTMGFITSASLLPAVFALALKITTEPLRISAKQIVLFSVLFTLMLFWTPAGLVFIPLITVGCFRIKEIIRNKTIIAACVLLIAVNSLWIAVFFNVSNVVSFLHSEKAAKIEAAMHTENRFNSANPATSKAYRHKTGAIEVKKVLKLLREHTVCANPLVLLLAIPGLFIFGGWQRYLFMSTGVWLMFLGGAISALKPQLELDRMLLLLVILMSIPSAFSMSRLLTSRYRKSTFETIISALAVGFFLTGPFAAGAIMRNRTIEQYYFASPLVYELSDAISENAGSGRTLFSGFMLQDLSGGHIAPLIYFTKKPLIASSYVHEHWRYTDVIPDSFRRRGLSGILDFIKLYNVSLVAAHERVWRDFFRSHPDYFKPVWHKNRFYLFKVLKPENSYFLSGTGNVIKQTSNTITVKIDSQDAVIKFRYFPFLKASSCRLSPYTVADGSRFISLTGCSRGEIVKIKSRNIFYRLFGYKEVKR